ncbi:MAG: hypothetical protein AVDCRST_MAG72-2522 [uncultured Nocardioidaceae bacterium]|uniref:ANTAR domain-containing protein n=1 Tax=uncultured Nocardioidaceae bacterium TaxID=253824 RepID=A0A6J4MMX2_9ACTN|nr:MAG: hypothetical protein AVDCRST_MAG72-2522 [uncultured Nocardioidaceae bacterium]
MSTQRDVADTLAEAAQTMDAEHTVEATLEAIVQAAKVSVPGFDAATVTVCHSDGRLETMAGTDQLAWDLDALQYSLGEGPCVDAIRRGADYQVEDTALEKRWPTYVRGARAAGVRSQLGVEMYSDGEEVAGLNLYSTTKDAVVPDARHIADLLAAHAALALGHVRQNESMRSALAARKVIGQALGIVMERHELDEGRALRFLVRISSTSNTELRDVAQKVVDRRTKPLRRRRTGL